MDREDLANRFSFHPATTSQKQYNHELVRSTCLNLAQILNGTLPEGREKSVAITKLEEVMFWGNAALAREQALGGEQ